MEERTEEEEIAFQLKLIEEREIINLAKAKARQEKYLAERQEVLDSLGIPELIASLSLPELIGSEKQIKWAEDIRSKAITGMSACLTEVDNYRELDPELAAARIKAASEITSAKVWIESRSSDAYTTISRVVVAA